MTSARRSPAGAGVGLRLPHLTDVVETRPPVAWFEVHAENFLANPHAAELLQEISGHTPISVHTVGVSIGSVHGLDLAHLARVKALCDRLDPALVSGHLAWSTHKGEYLNDLLPLPYTRETLDLLVEHVRIVQDTLGRPYLVENPSSYFGFRDSTMTETQLLAELVERTGCKLLCDVSNIHVSSHNLGYDPAVYLDALPMGAIAECHLGGFTHEDEGDGATVIVDTHDARIDEAAWALYAHAIARFGAVPTLIEWDSDIPAFEVLLEEAAKADVIAAAGSGTYVAR